MFKNGSYLVLGFILVVAAGCQRSADYREVKQYTIEQFMNTEAIGGSSFSHDDKLILYSSKKTGIYNAYTVPAEGGQPTQLTDSKTNSIFAVTFFPKDNRILYRSDQGGNEINHIYLRNEDGTTKDLTPGEKARSLFYGWSHDEQSFFSRRKVFRSTVFVPQIYMVNLVPSLVAPVEDPVVFREERHGKNGVCF